MPKPISEFSPENCKKIRGIFADIDDTISWQGKIPAAAYEALWRAKDAGLKVIPVTGRPAGWVDHIVRMWPVSAVVGENGAFYFHLDEARGRDGLLVRKFLQDEELRKTNQRNLWKAFFELKQKMPNLITASDQKYREIDLAIDFCEDTERLEEEQIQQIVAHFVSKGAQAKISSIHVNAWFGEHDKYSCCKLMMRELFQEDLDAVKDEYIYFGDSPNDEPFFQEFPHSVGVANVKDFLSAMKYPPQFVTEKSGGHGFAEAIDHILSHR